MRRLLIALLLAALPAAPAAAAPAGNGTMEVEAKTSTYDGLAHTYQVKGNVRISLPQLVVTCDEATVFANAAENQVVKVVFTGNVEAKKGTDSFKARTITYIVAERRLVAEGTTHARLKLPTDGAIKGP